MKTGFSLVERPALVLAGGVEEGAGCSFEWLGYPVRRIPAVSDFLRHMRSLAARVVVCEREMPDGSWKDILEIVCSLRPAPPSIVTSRLADERLWAEVLNLGGYDVLAKPLDQEELRRSLSLAWQHGAETNGATSTTLPIRRRAVS